MKIDNLLKETLLTKDQLKLNQSVIDYLINIRKNQLIQIQNQAPNTIPKQYNLLLSLFVTFIIVSINFDQLFKKVQQPSQITKFQNFQQIERKVEYVFEQTIMKYSVIYPMKIRDCQSYIPFVKSQTLCSEKSIDVKAKLIYSIGYKPNYKEISYNPQNNTFFGQWGPLQILSVTDDHIIQSERNGIINGWSVSQFQNKYQDKIKAIKPHVQQKINQYIQNITSNENSLEKFEQNIKNSLMKIMKNEKQNGGSLPDKILKSINKGFDHLLIFFSLEPVIGIEQNEEKIDFSQASATQFVRQQILIQDEQSQLQTSIEAHKQPIKRNDNTQPLKEPTKVVQDFNTKIQKYNSEQIRQKYNELLKKVK